MIAVCEPQCKGISHEKVNSGFIYGIRLAFPDEKMVVYADPSHIKALQDIITHDKLNINNIEFVPISFILSDSFKAFFVYYRLFEHLLKAVTDAGEERFFLLSFSPKILYIIKQLKKRPAFHKLKFTSILHGDFENVADDKPRSLTESFPQQSALAKIKGRSFLDILGKAYEIGGRQMLKLKQLPVAVFSRFFGTKKILLLNQSADFKYIALSPHAVKNAARYLDLEKFRMYGVVLPTVFAKPLPKPENSYVKFGVFGYGNSAMLKQIAWRLSQKEIIKPYEIRIIGMDNSGLEEFPNITCPSPGKRLPRADMERYAEDIDMFLILYDKTRYRLTCSGSILESLSYMKPILHFENDCINYFNREERPIGICCSTVEEFSDKMKEIIENYVPYTKKFEAFRENIMQAREEAAIENWSGTIRESFTW